MRIAAALALVAACGSSPSPAPELPSGEAPPEIPLDRATISAALRVAELHADGTALIEREGPPVEIGTRYVIATLDLNDGYRPAMPITQQVVVTVAIDAVVDEFLDYDHTQQFLVCGDSRGGDPPALYHAHIVDGDGRVPGPTSGLAWPAELELRHVSGEVRGGGTMVAIHHENTMEGEQFRLGDREYYIYHCAY